MSTSGDRPGRETTQVPVFLAALEVRRPLAAAVHEEVRARLTYAASGDARNRHTSAMSAGRAHAAERHRGADRGDPLLVAVEEVGLLGDGSGRRVTALTRTRGAKSTASVAVRLSSPALAAP